ncbi:response regulator transcription factor [Streptomyces sp. NPDC005811]|uniref:response regulator transcription factor n=1 Tax=Streptomyces sp. NPDC005811 TaxID=3154565 RepID=UPI0033E0D500
MLNSEIRVLIADDQILVRTGFRMILDSQSDITVVGEAADGAECVELARRLRPDVCLLDIRMPRLDGLEVARLLAGPGVADPVKVVMVTSFDEDGYLNTALRNGAVGFLLKDSAPALLIEAVRAARHGDVLVSPSVTVKLLKQLTRYPARPASTDLAEPPVSERELAVIRQVAVGRTNHEICEELCLSLSTVKTYLGRIHGKLGVRNRVEVAAWAWANGHVG